jgi:hypothetical protein
MGGYPTDHPRGGCEVAESIEDKIAQSESKLGFQEQLPENVR